MDKANRAKLMLITSMVIYGTIGLFRRYIPLGSATLAMTRGVIGVLVFLVADLILKRKISAVDIKRNLLPLILSGVFLGGNWILLFEAYNHTTVAVATMCYYMAPTFVILLSPLLFKERLTLRKWVCVSVALVGMMLITGVFSPSGEGASLKGVLFGLGAALMYTTVVLLNKIMKDISAFDKTVIQLGVSAVVLLPYVLLTEKTDTALLTPFVVAMVLVVGVLHTGIAYGLYFASIKRLPVQTVALFSYIDPVLAVVISGVFLSESIGVLEWVGIACILGATCVCELPQKNRLER